MTEPLDVTIEEGKYIDPRIDKKAFYRTFVFGSNWVTQNGRIDEWCTTTKIKTSASPEAALAAAQKKFLSKVKGGYEPSRSGVVSTTITFDDDNRDMLAGLVEALPEGQIGAIVSEPVEAADLGGAIRTDLTNQVPAAVHPSMGRATRDEDLDPALPVRPMLASVPTEDVLADAMTSDDWVAQYKYDGDRLVIEVMDGEIRAMNRQGKAKIRNVTTANLEPFTALHSGRWVFDGEVVGTTLVLFDMLMATDGTTTWIDEGSSFIHRHSMLLSIARLLDIPRAVTSGDNPAVVIAPVAHGEEEKEEFLSFAVANSREGIILRDRASTYESGRRSTVLIKHKLIKDADVIVTDLSTVKESATLSVHSQTGEMVEVGAASTIGKGAVALGDVWVVTFLNVGNPEFPRLFQPRLVARRDDKTPAECHINQFADAGANKEI